MGTDKHASSLRIFLTKVKESTEKIIYVKNKTADFIGQNVDKAKVLIGNANDKRAVFFDNVKYELKGQAFNTYDKLRFFIAEHTPQDGSADYIEYKGEPEPTAKETISTFISQKRTELTGRLPKSFSEVKEMTKHIHKSTKRDMRKRGLAFKDNTVRSFHYTRDYVTGIRKSTVVGLGSIAIFGFALTFMLTTIVSSYAMGVTINGEKVGFVESEAELASLVDGVEENLSTENHNVEIQIDENKIELDSMAEAKDEVVMLDENKLKETIMDTDVVTATAAAITVNGEAVLYVGTTEDANSVLSSIKGRYNVSGEDVIAGFREDVAVEDASVNVNDIIPTSNAITYLMTGNETIEKYKVKEDDTDWDIAQANGLTEKEIQEANPDMDTKVIKKGDVINISKMTPFVNMEIVATVTVTEKTKYKTKKVKTDELYVGETKVKNEGKRGEKSVTKRAVYVNGKEKSAQIIEENTVKKAKKRVVLVGTKEKPAVSTGSSSSSTGSSSNSPTYSSGGGSYVSGQGTLSNPMRNMELSSPFGSRGGGFHSGADFRNPAGTAIYAAAGGTVTYSGYDGAYGNTIRISHGNGMVTVYAHCKSLNVRRGASVSKGQQIATVGRTGRATGNHLHFEVRINGSAKNPLSYL